MNKHVCAAVTPVLPELCDVSALRLILPYFDPCVCEPPVEEYVWWQQMWWVVFQVRDQYFSLATSRTAPNKRFYPVRFESGNFGALQSLFDRDGQYDPQPARWRRVFTHALSGAHRPSEGDCDSQTLT